MIEQAVAGGLQLVQQDVLAHAARITETKTRISLLEEEHVQAAINMTKNDKLTQALLDRVEDLENRSRRSNLRFVGIPESYPNAGLINLCEKLIPKALGLRYSCSVERAHRLGPPGEDRTAPRAAIPKYLNYADKAAILQAYRRSEALIIDNLKILIFADYSPEVSKKRRAFSQCCTALYRKHIRFTFAYPATLTVHLPSGKSNVYKDPKEAEAYIQEIDHGGGGGDTPLGS